MDLKITTGLEAVSNLKSAGAKARPDKLREAAQQFESLMINEMMKSVKAASSSGWMGSEEGGDSAGESAMEMAQTQFAAALARSGGLGLAKMIEKAVAPHTHSAPASTK